MPGSRINGAEKSMKGKYGKITSQIIKELTAIVGKGGIVTDKDVMEGYSHDESPITKPHAPDDGVCRSDTCPCPCSPSTIRLYHVVVLSVLELHLI